MARRVIKIMKVVAADGRCLGDQMSDGDFDMLITTDRPVDFGYDLD